jgi:hypothetical protein
VPKITSQEWSEFERQFGTVDEVLRADVQFARFILWLEWVGANQKRFAHAFGSEEIHAEAEALHIRVRESEVRRRLKKIAAAMSGARKVLQECLDDVKTRDKVTDAISALTDGRFGVPFARFDTFDGLSRFSDDLRHLDRAASNAAGLAIPEGRGNLGVDRRPFLGLCERIAAINSIEVGSNERYISMVCSLLPMPMVPTNPEARRRLVERGADSD